MKNVLCLRVFKLCSPEEWQYHAALTRTHRLATPGDPTVLLSLLPSFFGTSAEMADQLGHPRQAQQWRQRSHEIAHYPKKRVGGKEVIANSAGVGAESGASWQAFLEGFGF